MIVFTTRLVIVSFLLNPLPLCLGATPETYAEFEKSIQAQKGAQNQEPRTRGPVVVLAAPEIAILALGALAAAVSVAASQNFISSSQAAEISREIAEKKKRVQDATDEAWEATKRAVVDMYDQTMVRLRPQTCPEGAVPEVSERSRADAKPRTKTITRAEPVTCTGAPKECCKPLFDKFEKNWKIESQSYRVWKKVKNAVKGSKQYDCCFEWDSLHGAFEIFSWNGKHLGEKACDDPSDDPCAMTPDRGANSLPNSSTHKPRVGGGCNDFRSK